jgi:D-beta-D-heptose 7-phosphate kinase/D-beta-D-heptose 1-phosphate adenosyltransferase
MQSDNLIDLLERLGSPRLLVVGDLVLERSILGNSRRIGTEAPTMPLATTSQGPQPGGAAAVAVLAARFGCRVRVAGVVGDDPTGHDLLDLLGHAGVRLNDVVIDRHQPTRVHDRYLAKGDIHHLPRLLQVERQCRQPLHPDSEEALVRRIRSAVAESEAVLVADLPQAAWGPWPLKALFAAAAAHVVPVLIRPGTNVDYGGYCGAALLTLDRAEAEQAIGLEIVTTADALATGRRLVRCCAAEAVLLNLGRAGMVLSETRACGRLLPVWPWPIRDSTAVADMLLAVLGTCRAEGPDWEAAARLATVAAALEASRPDVSPVSRADLWLALRGVDRTATTKLLGLEQAFRLLRQYHRSGQRVVLACGTFDLLSASELRSLQEASQQGNVLVVAVYSDRSLRRLQRPGRPVVHEHERAALMAALACVDHVVLFDAATQAVWLHLLRPDVLVQEGATTPEQVCGREVVEGYGGRVHITPCPGPAATVRLPTLRNETHRNGG